MNEDHMTAFLRCVPDKEAQRRWRLWRLACIAVAAVVVALFAMHKVMNPAPRHTPDCTTGDSTYGTS